jgi:hypothetical protein
MSKYLDLSVKSSISELINAELLVGKFNDIYTILDNDIKISELNEVFKQLLQSKSQISNIGIDLPLSFGDYSSMNFKTVVVALDPKRNDKSNKNQNQDKENPSISVGSIFNLHTDEGKNTGKNCYWEFVSHLTNSSFVYLTDIYKIYYESKDSLGQKLLSNKDSDFTEKNKPAYEKNISILKEEIKFINPNRIITLGKDARESVIKIMEIETNDEEVHIKKDNIEFIFLPHISTTVTQSTKTIGDLYRGLGIITKNDKILQIGNELISNKSIPNILNPIELNH